MMGCVQSSANVTSPPSINHIPIERLYGNEDYSLAQASPVVMITATPTPAYIKSVLKKVPPDGKEKFSLFNRRLPSIQKSVNFDEQVLVKARTPTPSKIWYEKASTTMPMRKPPRDDDDDDDYDYDEVRSVSSDDEEENKESLMSTVRPPTPLSRRNQVDPFGLRPTSNFSYEDDPFSSATQQPSFNTNIYATESLTNSPANCIKVRRKLPQLGPPQIVPISPYQSSIVLPYQSPIHSTYQIPASTSIVSPYQTPVQLSTFSSYPSPLQPFPVQRILQTTQSLPQTTHYAINRHPLENVV